LKEQHGTWKKQDLTNNRKREEDARRRARQLQRYHKKRTALSVDFKKRNG